MKKGIKIGNVFTDEMKAVIRNQDLTSQQVGDILRAVLYPGEFEASDGTAKMLARQMTRGYLSVTLACAESRLKELNRLDKYYDGPKAKRPDWFDDYYEANAAFLEEVIDRIAGVIDGVEIGWQDVIGISDRLEMPPLTLSSRAKSNNVSKHYSASSNVSKHYSESNNVSKHYSESNNVLPLQKRGSITSNNINTNTKDNGNGKSNDNGTDRDGEVPPKSPRGLRGAKRTSSRQPDSALDDPTGALGLAEGEGAADAAREGGDAPDPADANGIADEIEATYRYSVNRGKLRKCLRSVLKKNAAAEVLGGYRLWLEAWKADDFQWAPSRITDWLYDGRFREKPRRSATRAKPAVDPDTVSTDAHLDLV